MSNNQIQTPLPDFSDSGNQQAIPQINGDWHQHGLCYYPWRRWLARVVDSVLLSFVDILVLFLIVIPVSLFPMPNILKSILADSNSTVNIVAILIMGFLTILFLIVLNSAVEAVFISRFGATPAKWLFGIRVVHQSGALLSFKTAFKRSITVLIKGQVLYIPIFSFIVELYRFFKLNKTGTTPWDLSANAMVLHKKWGVIRGFVCTLVVIFLFVMITSGILLDAVLNSSTRQYSYGGQYSQQYGEQYNAFKP